jgi:integrase/recombinase XerD
VTRLRRIMLEELQRRNYSAVTTRNHLRVVTKFAKFFGKSPDKFGLNELRTYQAYLLRERKLTPGSVVNQVAALRFFFVRTLKRHQFRDFLPYPQDQRRLPTVLSREEVSRLLNAAGTLFRRTLLMTLYGTGMRRSELAHLKVGDIDSQRMIIRVVAGKRGKDRDLPLSPALLETLREYWRWRKPKLYLFPTRTRRVHSEEPISDKTPSGWHAARLPIGPASANALRILCAIVGPPICWKLAPTCARFQVLLGHDDLETTAQYLHLSQRHLQAVTNPLDTLTLSSSENVSRRFRRNDNE